MGRIKTFKDVVEWGLCVGCGACLGMDGPGAPSGLVDTDEGIRPVYDAERVDETPFLAVCPGYQVDSTAAHGGAAQPVRRYLDRNGILIGPFASLHRGFASDPDIRYRGSSGGVITALSLFCLEHEGVDYVVHTGMDPQRPWANTTVTSRTKNDLLSRAGSRYVASSPCESIPAIEANSETCVFIGKPCDVAAMRAAMNVRPVLAERIKFLFTFFCAGAPGTRGTKDLISNLGMDPDTVQSVRYRGFGWPGCFSVRDANGTENTLTYDESWGFVQRYRSLRCHLCPDGLGELADVTGGDAWDRYSEGEDGQSYILGRTQTGRGLVARAEQSGYLSLEPATAADVVAAQGLVWRRRVLFGRLLARRLFGIPSPRFVGFHLARSWMGASFVEKTKSILGTVKRIVVRGLWRRCPIPASDGSGGRNS